MKLLTTFTIGVGCALLAGCSNIAVIIENDSYGQLPNSHAIANLPYFPQEQDQCGPASLATMLGARDIKISLEELRSKVYIPARNGSLTTEMVARARRYGLIVYPLKPSLTDVLTEISAGNPVLVLQNLGFNWLPRWHFSVVTGYDLDAQQITLRSGKLLTHNIPLQLFSKTWRRADSWAVVITRPQNLPRTAEELRFLHSTNELELVGETKAALAAYQAAMDRWSTSPLASFGAGNTSYALQRFNQASEFFSAHIEQQPESAAGWNNLAYSLLKLDCYDEASSAMSCALGLAPGEPEYLRSYAEVLSTPRQEPKQSSCSIPLCPGQNAQPAR